MAKFKNKKVVHKDGKFDSQAELQRWLYLKDMEKNNEISGLKRQVRYKLVVDNNLICEFNPGTYKKYI